MTHMGKRLQVSEDSSREERYDGGIPVLRRVLVCDDVSKPLRS